jgi:hypothetical protein
LRAGVDMLRQVTVGHRVHHPRREVRGGFAGGAPAARCRHAQQREQATDTIAIKASLFATLCTSST